MILAPCLTEGLKAVQELEWDPEACLPAAVHALECLHDHLMEGDEADEILTAFWDAWGDLEVIYAVTHVEKAEAPLSELELRTIVAAARQLQDVIQALMVKHGSCQPAPALALAS